MRPTVDNLSFKTLRSANLARLPLFKNAQGGQAHSDPKGFDWTVLEWAGAVQGELGEFFNVEKKWRRGDFGPMDSDHAWEALQQYGGREIADFVIYACLLANRIGIDLGKVVTQTWNAKSAELGIPLLIEGDEWYETDQHRNPLEREGDSE